MSNFLIKKYKGIYTLRTDFDKQLNDFNRKLNGNYEDIDVYIKCASGGQIFYYGNRGTLQFYCPSLSRGRNIVREIYAKYINPSNVEISISEIQKDDKIITRNTYRIKDIELFQKDISNTENIIFEIEETDQEVLFKFKYQNIDKLIDLLKPLTSGCNRSPFSTKYLLKSNYKIPDEDLKRYKVITSNLPQNKLISLVHTSQRFLTTLATSQKKQDEMRGEMKRLGMKPKEYYHYIHKWDEYLDYLEKNIYKKLEL